MIDKGSLTADWINVKRKTFPRADPSIMERTIFALYLLEQLKLSGLEFVFKGGTCLMLLLKQAKRFSIDLDIILPPGMSQNKVEQYLSKVIDQNIFLRVDLDEKRSYKPGVPKAHYKFIFTSVLSFQEQEILVDILFEDILYPVLLQRSVESEWTEQNGDSVFITTPDMNSIAGDKLTAFAPGTVGIPYGADKEREIIKQLFDIGEIFDEIGDLEIVKACFAATVQAQIKYHGKPGLTQSDVLDDIIQTGLILANREKQPIPADLSRYAELARGISQFNYFLFSGKFRTEEAQTASAKAALLAAILKTDFKGTLTRFDNSLSSDSYLVKHPNYNFLNKKVKNVPGGCLFYWNEAIKLLYPNQRVP
jgi:hypothetical protein